MKSVCAYTTNSESSIVEILHDAGFPDVVRLRTRTQLRRLVNDDSIDLLVLDFEDELPSDCTLILNYLRQIRPDLRVILRHNDPSVQFIDWRIDSHTIRRLSREDLFELPELAEA